MSAPIKLSIYLARTFLVWFFIVFIAISAIVSLFEFSEFLRRGAGNSEVTLMLLVEMSLLKLPMTIEKLLPFVSLFASLLAFWKLNRSNELAVIRATGVSAWQFTFPALFSCAIIGIFSLTVLSSFSAVLKTRLNTLESRYFHAKKATLVLLETGLWLRTLREDGNQVVLRAGKFREKSLTFQDVMIVEQDSSGNLVRRFDAKKAVFDKKGLRLYQGYIIPYKGMPKPFKRTTLPSSLNPAILNAAQEEPESFSFLELTKFLPLLEKSGLPNLTYRLHWHGLMSQVFWLIAMALLAASCTLRPVRQGGVVRLVFFSLVLGFCLYILRNFAYAMGTSETLPVLLSAWLPTALTFALGSGFLLHFERH